MSYIWCVQDSEIREMHACDSLAEEMGTTMLQSACRGELASLAPTMITTSGRPLMAHEADAFMDHESPVSTVATPVQGNAS